MSFLTNFTLPTPRRTPLKRDSIQERNLLSHIERSLQSISTKIEHTSSGISSLILSDPSSTTPSSSNAATAEKLALARREGQYTSLSSLLADFDPLIDILYVSSTPWVQVPLLLTVIDALAGYVPLFGFRESEMEGLLSLLGKLDAVAETALHGREGRTYEWRWTVTTTQLVRLEGLSQQLRIAVVRYVNSQGPVKEGERMESKGLDAFDDEEESGRDEALGTTEDDEDDDEDEDGEFDGDDDVINIRLDRQREESTMDVGGEENENEFDGTFHVDEDDEPDWSIDMGRVMEKTVTACNSLLEARGGSTGQGASGSIADAAVPP